jgi:hypothetical protein
MVRKLAEERGKMTDSPPNEPVEEPMSPQGQASDTESMEIDLSTRELLDFSFVEVQVVPRLNRSCLSCS